MDKSMFLQLGQSQIRNPEKWKTKKIHKQTEQFRITIYCANQGQKENIQRILHNSKINNNDKKIGDTLERLLFIEKK